MLCDQSPCNMKSMKLLGASLLRNTPMVHTASQLKTKLPIIFDVQNLLKSVRNNFKHHGMKVDSKNIKWKI